jgi:hypothetical protein
VRYAARRPLEELFDDLALRAGLVAQRLDTASFCETSAAYQPSNSSSA